MGSRGTYNRSNGFKTEDWPHNYVKVDDPLNGIIDGIKVKHIKYDKDNGSNGAPLYANSSNVYIFESKDGLQMRIYKNHAAYLDIDFEHLDHHPKDPHNGFHVHEYTYVDTGNEADFKAKRTYNPNISDEVLAKYMPIIAELRKRVQ